MKFKILVLIVSLFTVSLSLSAKPIVDSVGVKNNDGKKLILFKVKAKDTYYSIGKRYNVKPDILMKFNGHKNATLTIGSTIEIPTDQPFKTTKKTKTSSEKVVKETQAEKKARLAREAKEQKKQEVKEQPEKHVTEVAEQPEAPERIAPPVVQKVQQPEPDSNVAPTQYKVSAGETLYAISKRFNTTVDAISKLNNLPSTTLIAGQVLLVRPGTQASPPAAPPIVNNEIQTVKRDSTHIAAVNTDSSNADHHLNANRYGLYEKNEKGVATWIDDPSLDPNKKLVLHRSAPIGTVIKITNPMTNRTTFAKVVGRFTDSEATKDVIIVMTKNVADSLGALDKRFHVDISYGSPNE